MPNNTDIHEKIIATEAASEFLNRVRALIMARVYAIENTAPASAELLMIEHEAIRDLQLSLRFTDPGAVAAVTSHWGPLVIDEAAFWASINHSCFPQMRG